MRSFFATQGMELFDVARIGTHGGSIRGFAQPAGGGWQTSDAVDRLVAREVDRGLDRPATFRTWVGRIDERKEELLTLLRAKRAEGQSIAGFGAPAKATTLMYQFEIGPEILEFIVDESPLKQGLYTPGLHVPVVPPAALAERKPDCLLVLAWNFADSIIDRYRSFIDQGGTFIVPLPRLRVVER